VNAYKNYQLTNPKKPLKAKCVTTLWRNLATNVSSI